MIVSIIIPCYNEEKTIQAVLERVVKLPLDGATKEIIVVNDGSTDGTRKAIDGFVFPPDVVPRIHHSPTNLGKGAGLRIGMALATGDVIAFQDADLELAPEELPKLIRPVLEGQADVVYGSRFRAGLNAHVPRHTRWANWLLSTTTNLLFGARITDMETAYKVFSRTVRDHVRLRCVGFDIEPEITAKILRLGFRIEEMPITYAPRSVAQGKKIGWADGVEALRTLWRLRWVPRSACERPVRATELTAAEKGRPDRDRKGADHLTQIPAARSRNPAYRRAGLMMFLVAVPLLVKAAYYPGYPGSDDAFIHLAVARNVITGHGWGINPGEPVAVSSSPLFTLLLSAAGLAGLDMLKAGIAASLGFTVLALLLLWRHLARIVRVPGLVVAGVLLGAFNVHLWRWNGVVMETTMAFAVVALAFYLYYAVRRDSLASAVGLGVVLGLVAGFAVLPTAWFIFARLYFGSFMPTTYHAKTSAFHLYNYQVLKDLASVTVSFALVLILVLSVAVAAARLGARSGQTRGVLARVLRQNAAMIAFPVLLFLFYYCKTDRLQSPARYYLPALYSLPILFVLLLQGARETLSRRWMYGLLTALAIGQVSLCAYMNHFRVYPVLSGFRDNYWRAMANVADYLTRICRDNDTVLVVTDIGVLAYQSAGRFRIADGGALASPELANLDVAGQIASSRPRYIVYSLGATRDSLKGMSGLERLHWERFKSHGVQDPTRIYYATVYRRSDSPGYGTGGDTAMNLSR